MAGRLTPSRIFRRHLLAILGLAALNAIALIGDLAGFHSMLGFSDLLRLSGEGNLPTLFSALALAATALVAARLSQAGNLRGGEQRGWRVFAWLLAFMALDEAIQLHEILTGIGLRYQAAGPWRHIGIFPYALVAIGLSVLLFRFWAEQSRTVRRGIALAGICYLVAAVGMEIPENLLVSHSVSPYDFRRAAFFAVEELGEMIAVALFLRTFLLRFAELGGGPLLALTAIEIEPAPRC